MNIDYLIRKLAKNQQLLNLFVAAKEVAGIRLFINQINFSRIQQLLLSYLYFYYHLNLDILSKEVNPKVLTDEIYEDAYSYYKKNKEDIKKDKKKCRTFYGVFSKDNKIKFPTPTEVN